MVIRRLATCTAACRPTPASPKRTRIGTTRQTFRARAEVGADRQSDDRAVAVRADAAHQRHRHLLDRHLQSGRQRLLQRQRAARSEQRSLVYRRDQGRLEPAGRAMWCRTPRISRASSTRSRTTRSGHRRSSTRTEYQRPRRHKCPPTSPTTRTTSPRSSARARPTRPARLQWNAGLFYSHVNENSTEQIYERRHRRHAARRPDSRQRHYLQPTFSSIDKQAAVFGEAYYKLTDTFNASAGLRYSRDRLHRTCSRSKRRDSATPTSTARARAATSPLTPRFVLNYQPDARQPVLRERREGLPAGRHQRDVAGELHRGPRPEAAAATFKSDSLWQYELGTKKTLLEQRLQVSASIYYLQWKNIQQFVYLTCGLGFDSNLGEATGKGGDIEVAWRATRGPDIRPQRPPTPTPLQRRTSRCAGETVKLVTAGDHLPPRRGTSAELANTCSTNSRRSRICASTTSTPRRSAAWCRIWMRTTRRTATRLCPACR